MTIWLCMMTIWRLLPDQFPGSRYLSVWSRLAMRGTLLTRTSSFTADCRKDCWMRRCGMGEKWRSIWWGCMRWRRGNTDGRNSSDIIKEKYWLKYNNIVLFRYITGIYLKSVAIVCKIGENLQMHFSKLVYPYSLQAILLLLFWYWRTKKKLHLKEFFFH